MKFFITYNNRLLIPFLVIIISLLTACQPRHFTSNVPVQKSWSTKDNYSSVIPNKKPLPCIAWWKRFNDPTLNKLVKKALVANNTLNQSHGNVEAATGELRKIKLQWIPNIDLLLGYSQNPATGFPGFLALFAPSYTLNIFKQIEEQKRAHHELAEAKAEDDTVRLYVIGAITSAYITYVAEREHEALVKQYLADLERIDTISVNLEKGGITSQIPEERIHSQVNELQGELEQVKHNVVLSRNAIHYLINSNPSDFPLHHTFSYFHSIYNLPKILPLTVLRQRPDMRLAIHRLTAANAEIGVEASDLLSEMHLDLFAGPISRNNRYTLPRFKYMIYFNDQLLRIPLLRPYVLGEIDKAKGLQKKAYFAYLDTLQKILQDTTNALSAHDRLTRKLLDTERSLHHHANIYRLNQALSTQGIQSDLDTLDSKIQLDQKAIAVNRDKLQSLLVVIKLYQELGGGYRVKSTGLVK